jgi:tetratricopeptide (TPR) repeat protein
LAFVVFLTIFAAYKSYRWVMADHYYNQSISFNKVNRDTLSLLAGLKAIEYNKQSKLHYANVGRILIKTKQHKRAEPYFKKAIDISPFNTPALLNLALIYDDKEVQDLDKQRKVLEFILSFDSRNVLANCLLVKNLILSNRSQDANIVYSRLKKSFEYFKGRPGFGPYHGIVGYLAKSIGDYKYAQYVYQDGVDRFPTAENYVELATIEFNFLQNLDKGIVLYKKALELNPNVTKNQSIKALIKQYESNAKQ